MEKERENCFRGMHKKGYFEKRGEEMNTYTPEQVIGQEEVPEKTGPVHERKWKRPGGSPKTGPRLGVVGKFVDMRKRRGKTGSLQSIPKKK